MKSFRSLLLLVFLCGMSFFAKADSIDFQFQVLDPPLGPSFAYLDGTPFSVTFGACPNNIAAQGCFFGYNESNYTFTSLSLTFTNSVGSPSNDYIHYLNGQTPTCNTGSFSGIPGAFASANCALSTDMSTYTLDYFGGPGVGPGSTLILAEIGPDPEAFGTGNGTVTLASLTPEPGSIVMLSTGIMALGMLLFKRRRDAPLLSRQR